MRKRAYLVKSLKIALAALVSIAIAGELGLKNSATAGIITILSIQNTKRETLKSAGRRALAFLCALVLAAVIFGLLGFTLPAFGIFLFLFAVLCLNRGWMEALTTASVLISHFLAAESMSLGMVINESLLFVIGAGTGILVNLHLHRKSKEFDRLAEEVDVQIKGILLRMSRWLLAEDKSGYRPDCFEKLEESLEAAGLCAAANYNNRLRVQDPYEIEYIVMRRQQAVVLQGIYENIRSIDTLPDQAHAVAQLLDDIQQQYHKDNTAEEMLDRIRRLFEQMREEKLPVTREEFETRAILFYIMKQMERLIAIKHEFIAKYVVFRCF